MFDFQYRDLWDWGLELVRDRSLAPYMDWDARRQYVWKGDEWEHFVDEPCTAKAFWNAQVNGFNIFIILTHSLSHQSELPHDASTGASGTVLAFLLYADKTKLSSFGTAKGYPIIARLANLHSSVRNGTGKGGGRVVGWLPIVISFATC